MSDWILISARSASYDGLTIVGFARKGPSGGDEAFMARLNPGTFIPEPSSLSIAAFGAVAFFALVCRKRSPVALHN
jgi:hypothetical protein